MPLFFVLFSETFHTPIGDKKKKPTCQIDRSVFCCPPQGRKLLQWLLVQWLVLVVAVPRRGASCYTKTYERGWRYGGLLSPAGARVVTGFSERIAFAIQEKRCCPPQGRELLQIMKYTDYTNFALLSPAGARVVTDVVQTGTARVQGLLSPAGARVVTQVSKEV